MAVTSFNSTRCEELWKAASPGEGALLVEGEKASEWAMETSTDSAVSRPLPSLTGELTCIFSSLSAGGYVALSTACKKLGGRTCAELNTVIEQFYRARCQALLASDTQRHLFTSFGIKCPAVGEATPERMQAIVSRVAAVIASLAAFAKTNFQNIQLPEGFANFFLAPQLAERLVMQLPADHLQQLLAVAYNCSLYTLFAPCAAFVPIARSSTLIEATRAIHHWLRTDAAKQVTEIKLTGKTLACLPVEIGQLSGLRALELEGHWLATLPPELGQLQQLSTLYLGCNQFEKIPSCIGRLSGLNELSLGHNRVRTLQIADWQALKLKKLYLDHNQLHELPPWVGQLTNLEVLSLSGNRIRALQTSNWQALKLVRLYLDYNQLEAVPPWVGQLTKLELLNLSCNHLREFRPEVWRARTIAELYLDRNQLEVLPDWLGQLPGPRWLNLAHNPLKKIPTGLGQQPALIYLVLDQKQYAMFHAELGRMQERYELFHESGAALYLADSMKV